MLFRSLTSKENTWIIVYDIYGKPVYKELAKGGNDAKITIHREIFSKGIYFVNVVSKDEVAGVNKLIVQ